MRIKTLKELTHKKLCKELGIKYLDYNTGKLEIREHKTKKSTTNPTRNNQFFS